MFEKLQTFKKNWKIWKFEKFKHPGSQWISTIVWLSEFQKWLLKKRTTNRKATAWLRLTATIKIQYFSPILILDWKSISSSMILLGKTVYLRKTEVVSFLIHLRSSNAIFDTLLFIIKFPRFHEKMYVLPLLHFLKGGNFARQ